MLLRDSRHPSLTEPRPIGRGNYLWIKYVLFRPHRNTESLPRWGISSMPGPPPRHHQHERRYTSFTHTFIWYKDKYEVKWYSGNWERTRKNLPRKFVPTGNRIRTRCVTGSHVTVCYRLFHSGAHLLIPDNINTSWENVLTLEK